MEKRTCAVFIFDGFADHEVALTMACLNKTSDFSLETFSTRGQAVTAMSGLRILPHTSLQYMAPEDFDLLLLPGGNRWEKGDNLDVFPLIKATVGRQLLAAIGDGTLALADLGLLDNIPHTSNFPGYLQQFCPDYEGARFYQSQPFVSAGSIITINGMALPELAQGAAKHFGRTFSPLPFLPPEMCTLRKI
jgi:putative intracellular protease/amidase